MRADALTPLKSHLLGMRLLIALLLCALTALSTTGCATTSSPVAKTTLKMTVAPELRAPCDLLARLTDEQLVAIARMTPMETDRFYNDRDLQWVAIVGLCEARGDTLVKIIDDANRIAAELEKKRAK